MVILSPDGTPGEAGRIGFLVSFTNSVHLIRWILYTGCTMYVNNEQETETIREEYLLYWKTGITIISE